MDLLTTRKILNRICAGKSRIGDFSLNKTYQTLIYIAPSLEDNIIADEVYEDVLCEAIGLGLYSAEDCIDLSYEDGFWDDEQEERLQKIPRDIEEMKLLIYQRHNRPTEVEMIRANLRAAENLHSDLLCQKYIYDYLSAENVARSFRISCLIQRNLYYSNNQKVFTNDYWMDSTSEAVIVNLHKAVASLIISDAQYRYIARNEPWKTTWLSGKEASQVFSVAAIHMSDEQKQLIGWSKLYDSVYDAHERPSQPIINDDDALDGWMVHVNRKRNEELQQQDAGNFTSNKKIQEAGEIYILGNKPREATSPLSKEDREGVYNMNTAKSKKVIQNRNKFLKEAGSASEQQLPDVKARFMQEVARAGMESIKRRAK